MVSRARFFSKGSSEVQREVFSVGDVYQPSRVVLSGIRNLLYVIPTLR